MIEWLVMLLDDEDVEPALLESAIDALTTMIASSAAAKQVALDIFDGGLLSLLLHFLRNSAARGVQAAAARCLTALCADDVALQNDVCSQVRCLKALSIAERTASKVSRLLTLQFLQCFGKAGMNNDHNMWSSLLYFDGISYLKQNLSL